MANYESITKEYFRSLNLFNEFENSPKDFGIDELLYPSEIHTVVLIVEKPNLNLTELSIELGVSKSAVSKFVNKLIDKKLVVKEKSENNNKEVYFIATPKGIKAAKKHNEFEKELFGEIKGIIDSLSETHKEFLEEFLLKLNSKVLIALKKANSDK